MNERDPQSFDSKMPTSWMLRNQISKRNKKTVISLVIAGIASGFEPVAGLLILIETGYQIRERHILKKRLHQRLDEIQQNITQIISVNKNNI